MSYVSSLSTFVAIIGLPGFHQINSPNEFSLENSSASKKILFGASMERVKPIVMVKYETNFQSEDISILIAFLSICFYQHSEARNLIGVFFYCTVFFKLNCVD